MANMVPVGAGLIDIQLTPPLVVLKRPLNRVAAYRTRVSSGSIASAITCRSSASPALALTQLVPPFVLLKTPAGDEQPAEHPSMAA